MRRLSLGRTTDVSLEQARERANELTSAARGGRDLVGEEGEARDAAASRITVEKLIALYLRRRVVGRLRTAKSIESRLRRTLAPILQRYAADICRRDMREILDSIADRGQGREAEKRRQVCTAMFRWALSQDIVERPHRRADAIRPRRPARSGLDRRGNQVGLAVAGVRRALSGSGRHSEARVFDRRAMRGDCRASRRGDRSPEMDLDAACRPLEKWPSAGDANCGPGARDARTSAVWIETGPLFLLEKGVVMTSAHIGHYLLTRRTTLPIATFTSHDLRRTFATMMAEMGMALDLVAAIVGPSWAAGIRSARILRSRARRHCSFPSRSDTRGLRSDPSLSFYVEPIRRGDDVSKILVIGAAGLLGAQVVDALGESECVRASRRSGERVDISDPDRSPRYSNVSASWTESSARAERRGTTLGPTDRRRLDVFPRQQTDGSG